MARSLLQLPITLHQEALERALNDGLPGVLVDDADFQGRGIRLRVRPAGRVRVAFRPPLVANVRLTLAVEVEKRSLLGRVWGTGTLSVELATELELHDDWALRAATEVRDTDWAERPRLGVLGLRVPVDRLLDAILERSRTRIAREVDARVAALPLGARVQALVARGWEPRALPLPHGDVASVLARPSEVGLARPEVDADEPGVLRGALRLRFDPAVALGLDLEAPAVVPPELPNAGAAPTDDEFDVTARVVLGYDWASRVLAEAAVGQVVRKAGLEIRLEHLELRGGAGRSIVIDFAFAGDLGGSGRLTATPVYDADSARVELAGADVKLTTSNSFANLGVRLLRGAVAGVLERVFADRFAEGLARARRDVGARLFGRELQPGITLEGALERLDVTDVGGENPAALTVSVRVAGRARLEVRELPTPPGRDAAIVEPVG